MGGSLFRQWTLVLGLGLTVLASAFPVEAQTTPAANRKAKSGDQMDPRDVTGTVKQVSGDGIVVIGRESNGKSREWAFALDGSTRIEKSDRTAAASALKVGDPVAVTYVERSGQIVAQSVKLLASPGASAPGAVAPGSRTAPGTR
jgi:Domain of unknown function (DUF5666)